MFTNEKQQPEPDVKPDETSRFLVHTVVLIIVTFSTTLFFSLTRINADDSLLEGILKLVPPFGTAVLLQAVVVHIAILRAIWTGRFPDTKPPTPSTLQRFVSSWLSATYFIQMGWRHTAGYCIGVMWAFCAYHSLWWALRFVRAAGERSGPLRAACAAEKGHASTVGPTAGNSHSAKPPRLTTLYMLGCACVSFVDLAIAIYSETLDAALAFFGLCFLAALIIAALMLHGALSLPHIMHGSNNRQLVFAYRCGGLIVLPWTCLALGFVMWYYKGQPLYPGVYCAMYWAGALYMGVGEVLEQSLLSS